MKMKLVRVKKVDAPQIGQSGKDTLPTPLVHLLWSRFSDLSIKKRDVKIAIEKLKASKNIEGLATYATEIKILSDMMRHLAEEYSDLAEATKAVIPKERAALFKW